MLYKKLKSDLFVTLRREFPSTSMKELMSKMYLWDNLFIFKF